MKVKEIICIEKYGNVKEISDYNKQMLQNMITQMVNPSSLIPSQFYKDWAKGEDSFINKLSESLINDYPVEIKCGYKTKNFFITSLCGFDIKYFILSKWNFKIDFTQSKLLPYDFKQYRTLVILVMSLVISKYKLETLYHEHIIFIGIKVILTFFTLYQDEKFLVHLEHMHDVVSNIFETDISVFEEISEKYGFAYHELTPKAKSRTLTKQEIMEFINPEDSQTTIKEKIMKWCPCGERKARKIMQQYGLTDQKYTRKDNKEKKTANQ